MEEKRPSATLQEVMGCLLACPLRGEQRRQAAALGLPPSMRNNAALMAMALFEQARDGNMQAIKEVRSLAEGQEASRQDGVVILDDISAQ